MYICATNSIHKYSVCVYIRCKMIYQNVDIQSQALRIADFGRKLIGLQPSGYWYIFCESNINHQYQCESWRSSRQTFSNRHKFNFSFQWSSVEKQAEDTDVWLWTYWNIFWHNSIRFSVFAEKARFRIVFERHYCHPRLASVHSRVYRSILISLEFLRVIKPLSRPPPPRTLTIKRVDVSLPD